MEKHDTLSVLYSLFHRLHELLIENDELKQKLDERESEVTGKMKGMEDRTKEIEENNQYLSQLVWIGN